MHNTGNYTFQFYWLDKNEIITTNPPYITLKYIEGNQQESSPPPLPDFPSISTLLPPFLTSSYAHG